MKHLRKFNSVQELNTAVTADKVSFIGMVEQEGQPPVMAVHVHVPVYPSNLQISCSNNTVTISATNATTIEYKLSYEGTYVTYTEPFAITETVTVWAKASNSDGSIETHQECVYGDKYTTPFYIEDVSGSVNTLKIKKESSGVPTLTIEKSTDGTIWETMGTTSTEEITATIPANGKLYLRCNTDRWDNTHINMTANSNVGGNIMSLLYGSEFTGSEREFKPTVSSGYGVFGLLFYNNTHLINASELILPATTLVHRGYYQMFTSCSKLITAPELPATTLDDDCYDSMFSGCTSLTTAPSVLPAEIAVSGCYSGMFYNCTSLTTAPTILATTLYYRSCYYMFYKCSKLNYVKCLVTNRPGSQCTEYWLDYVASTGTFVKDPTTTWGTGASGIPSGWTVRDNEITLSQSQNVVTIEIHGLDTGTGYYTINGGSHVSISEGTTNVPITQAMNGQTLLVYGEFSGESQEKTIVLSWVDYTPTITITESENYVTISAPNANIIQYRLGSSGEYTRYTTPVYINENTTIYVTATRTVSGVDYTANTSQAVTHEVLPPTNLTISCLANFVTISAFGAATFEYNTDGSSNYTTYTTPFAITETVTVWAKASNVDGSIYGHQLCEHVDEKYATPFYIEDMSGSDNTVSIVKNNSSSRTLTIEKSTDGGMWETMGTTSTTAITATIPANGKLYLRCNTTTWANNSYYYNNINTTGNCNIGGNINSLLYGNTFNAQTEFPSNVDTNTLSCLFILNTHIINAENLLLPATILTNSCYVGMFNSCTSLTTAPALPATTLAQSCYSSMFRGCTSLTTAPTLSATALSNYCYYYMFYNCTSLTTAPALPATTLAQYCYYWMFHGCSNLNYIKCLATDKSATSCTTNWVSGVAASGTFVKDPNMSNWTTGNSGIPTNWDIRDYVSGISLSQSQNVATIEITGLDTGTGYYTINGGSQVSISEGTTTIPITQAMNNQTLLVYGEFSGESQQETLTLSWTDYRPTITISESQNYVTITAPNANSIQYRLGSSGEYTTYTAPVYIDADTTIYVTATRTVSGVDYTANASQAVTHELMPPTNLVISCSNNFVTISATRATTLEYNLDGGSNYTTYTEPFYISHSGTVYARATNSDGSITASQAVTYVDYAPTITISESQNYVTISAPNANSIQYRLGSSGEYTTYTAPVYIASDTTIYVTATRTVSGVDYTANASEEVTHTLIPPTNLVISCSNNTVTITATNATTLEYNTNGSSTYTTYTAPFAITQTVTVYAKATNADGSITASQECVYVDGKIFEVPLTQNNVDIIGNRTPITGYTAPVSYDSTKGAQFIYSQDKYLVYRLTKNEVSSVKCSYCEIIPQSGSTRNMFVFQMGSPDVLTNGLYIMSPWINTSLKLNTTSQYADQSSANDTSFNYSLTSNSSYKIAIYQYSNTTQKIYINGALVATYTGANATSSYYGSQLNDSNCGVVIGSRAMGRTGSNARVFNGYIKNFVLYSREFTDAELIQLTT